MKKKPSLSGSFSKIDLFTKQDKTLEQPYNIQVSFSEPAKVSVKKIGLI